MSERKKAVELWEKLPDFRSHDAEDGIDLISEALSAARAEGRREANRALIEAAEGYIGNGCECKFMGDAIVHLPEHCRQCRLMKAIEEAKP